MEEETYEVVDGLLLKQLVASELEGTLEEVASGGRTEASEQCASTLALDNLFEPADEAPVVFGGVELDSGFYAKEMRKMLANCKSNKKKI